MLSRRQHPSIDAAGRNTMSSPRSSRAGNSKWSMICFRFRSRLECEWVGTSDAQILTCAMHCDECCLVRYFNDAAGLIKGAGGILWFLCSFNGIRI